MKHPPDLAGQCPLCLGVIVWSDGSMNGLGRIENDAKTRGLKTSRLPRSDIRQLPQGHDDECPNKDREVR